MGVSFSSAQPLPGHGAGGTVPRATGIADCSKNILRTCSKIIRGKSMGPWDCRERGQPQGVGSPRRGAEMPSDLGTWALSRGHVAIHHSLVCCCCRSPFPAHLALIPAPWHCCALPHGLGDAMVSPRPAGKPPRPHAEGSGLWLTYFSHWRAGPAPRQLSVPAAQSCRDTGCFPSDPPNLVSFFPESREQTFSPNGPSCHIGANLELLLAFSFLGSALPHQPGCRVSRAELCPGT